MRKFALLVALVVFGWSSGASALPIEWTVASGGNGHWYDTVGQGYGGSNDSYLWGEARVDAESRGGYLATMTSASEWSFLQSSFPSIVGDGSRMGWLGAYQTNPSGPNLDSWTWITGESWTFTDWYSGEPNGGGGENHLVVWFHEGSGWNDHWDGPFRYYVEYDTNPVPEPSTALLLGFGLVGLAVRRKRAN
jgi:hypothetical protein